MQYKTSQYTYFIEDNSGSLRLYNSLRGSKSLFIVNPLLKTKIYTILNDCASSKWNNDADFLKLYQNGFIVDEETNEISIGETTKNDVVNYPGLMLTIMPTEDCNFRCVYCYEDHKKGKMSKTVQNSIIKFVQKNIRYYTELNVGWFGGEPLDALDVIENLSKRLIDICNVARKKYSAGMTTNGYNLDIDTFMLMQRLKVFDYQITIDSLKEIHDKYRCLKDGSGTFDKIVENIENIHKLSRRSYNIDIRTNFTAESIEVLPQYLEFCEKLFGNDSRFSLFVHLVGNWGGDSVKAIDSKLISNSAYSELLREIISLKPNVSFRAHIRDLEPFHSKCYAALRNSYVIGSDGAIYKCTEGFDMLENRIGYLTETGDMVIDKTKHRKWLDIEKNAGNNGCLQCAYWGCCLNGPCPKAKIIAKKQDGTFCPRTRNSIHEIMLLLENTLYQQF